MHAIEFACCRDRPGLIRASLSRYILDRAMRTPSKRGLTPFRPEHYFFAPLIFGQAGRGPLPRRRREDAAISLDAQAS